MRGVVAWVCHHPVGRDLQCVECRPHRIGNQRVLNFCVADLVDKMLKRFTPVAQDLSTDEIERLNTVRFLRKSG